MTETIETKKDIIVFKYGGSSICSAGLCVMRDRLINMFKDGAHNKHIVLVISAMGKTTNKLYSITNMDCSKYTEIYTEHQKICEEIRIDFQQVKSLLEMLAQDITDYQSKPFIDITQQKLKIISYGEYLSSMIVHKYLESCGLHNKYMNAHTFIKNKNTSDTIDADSLNIKGEFVCNAEILKGLTDYTYISVTQGFIASTNDNKYCILTRSGSNTSAALIANALNAQCLYISTDVSGLYTTDPRKVQSVKKIDVIDYSVCQEAAAMGSQIIHPYSIKPCQEKHIPIHICSTFGELNAGTIIKYDNIEDKKNMVHLIACQSNTTVFQITSIDMWETYGFVYDIFSVFNDEKIDINIVTTSQFSITTTTCEKVLAKLQRAYDKLIEKYKVNVIQNCTTVNIVADNVRKNPQIRKIHDLIDTIHENIHVIHYGANNMSLSYVVDESFADNLTKQFHELLIN